MEDKKLILENAFNDLLIKYQKSIEKNQSLQRKVNSLKASSIASEDSTNSIRGIEIMALRISAAGKIEYVNQNFSNFFKVKKADIIGKDSGILNQLSSQSLLEKVRPIKTDGAHIVEAMDETGEHFKVKMTSMNGALDVVMENITDHYKFRDYVKKYISVDLTHLSDDDLTTFKFPERRFMTVSFTNLKGFTLLSETLLPAQLRKAVNIYLESCIQAIEKNLATVDKIIGDEVMALFGAPKYFQDHALRALKSAADQISGMQQVKCRLAEIGIQVRGCGIGINTGEMVVGSIGSLTRKDYTVMGSSVNIAAKLSKIAHEGEILMTEHTLNAALKTLPQGWIALEKVPPGENNNSRHEISRQILPLQNNTKKTIVVGPRDKPVFIFQYMFSLRMKGVRYPLTIIRATILNAAGNKILNDGNHNPVDSERLFGKFRLVERLGKGGMGEVWRGRDDYGNELGIKTLLAGEYASESQIQRFMHEAEVMTKLHHRGICRIHEVGEVDHINYIAMEFVLGVSLSQLLEYSPQRLEKLMLLHSTTAKFEINRLSDEFFDPRQRLPAHNAGEYQSNRRQGNLFKEKKVIELTRRICSAIQFAHEHHVFHRDIKPQNILMRPDGEPVIMDFGIARIRTQTDAENSARKGRVFGTIEYMSPEQALSSETSDACSDIYAIGAVMYQMVTGRKHFTSSNNIIQDIKRLQRHEPVSPSFYNKKLSADMEAIILKALNKTPEKRYASASELGDDLRKLQAGEPVSARAGTLAYRLGKKLIKKKEGVSLILIILAILGGFLSYIFIEQRKQWGNWVLVYQTVFDMPGYQLHNIRFRDKLNRSVVPPFTINPEGMKMRPRQWCWLEGARELKLWGDIRVVVNFHFKSHPDALHICINSRDIPTRSWDRVPPGHTALHAAGMGALDILSKVEDNQLINISNAVASRGAQGKRAQVMFQQIDDRLTYFLNGRQTLALQDILPRRGQRFQSIGLMSVADSLYLQSIQVYRLSLPEKASPLIAGEALLSRGKLQEALDEYLTISEDYFGTEVAEQALAKAYAISFENHEQFSRFIEPIKSDFIAHYPDSRLVKRLLEIETMVYWKEKNYERALDNLDKLFETSPGPPILFQLDYRELPPALSARFLAHVKKAGKFRSFNLTPGCGLVLTDFQGMDLNNIMAGNMGLKSLAPLASSNLAWLWIPDNAITGLQPLAGLPLKLLNGNFNRISDVSPLAKSRLEFLHLQGNNIATVESLGAIPLENLNLSMNRLQQVESIRTLPLVKLNLARNNLKKLPLLTHRKLTDLNISDNRLADLEPLRGQPITTLDFSHNLVSEIAVLSGMPVQYIYAGHNRLHDIFPLKGKKIQVLCLAGNTLHNYDALNAASITSLCLRESGLENMPPLHSLIMERLDVSHNSLTSLEPLENLRLKQLNCANNQISNLIHLDGMNLNSLNCQNNQLNSLYPFYSNPPDTFYFHCSTLPELNLKRAIDIWSKNPRYQYNLHYAECMLAIRRNDADKLKRLGKTFKGHHYLHITAPMKWQEASDLSGKLGGHLVTIADKAENGFLHELLRDTRYVWIGLRSQAGQWKWITDEPLSFNNALNPNSAICYPTLLISSYHNGGKWVPGDRIQEAGFVIEWEE